VRRKSEKERERGRKRVAGGFGREARRRRAV
jgi:hypothetical protein